MTRRLCESVHNYFQIDKIKELARFYAELPDNDFNSLAVNANDHSLVSWQQESPVTVEMRSTCTTTTASAAADLSQNFGNGDGIKLSTCRLALKTTHSAKPSQCVVRLPCKAGKCHELSSYEQDVEEMEAMGVFDYVPPKSFSKMQAMSSETISFEGFGMSQQLPVSKQEMVVVKHAFNQQFDEEVTLDESEETVESPRSSDSSFCEYDVALVEGNEAASISSSSVGFVGILQPHISRPVLNGKCRAFDDHHQSANGLSVAGKQQDGLSSLHSTPSNKEMLPSMSLKFTNKPNRVHSVDDSINFACLSSSKRPCPPFGSGSGHDLLKRTGESIDCLLKPQYCTVISLNVPTTSNQSQDKKKRRRKKGNNGWSFSLSMLHCSGFSRQIITNVCLSIPYFG